VTASIRPATDSDLPALEEIYAHYVANSPATFHEEAPSLEDWRRNLASAGETGHPWLVSEADGEVTGYATGSPHRPKEAYRLTVETTVYLRDGATGRGLGRALYRRLLDDCRSGGFHLAVAGITLPNDASVRLHEALGFTEVGVFTEVGRKLGAWRDVGWWQLLL
jgi:phosphinothricin acetyltransferase